ncbi:MAG TPA: coproporphyrinogen-III oxidase family protein [Pirellulaceae bacterium]|nr:coproporphyrinogen-III oxidase family protein [Pirellulaceae bacterium]
MDIGELLSRPDEVARLAAVLGDAARVSYAPPNIYPMAAPLLSAGGDCLRRQPGERELGIYVHVPYCNYSCTFCFYATRLTPQPEEMQRYVRALTRELAWVTPGMRLSQLYVGGGTPTTLPPALLDELLAAVCERMTPRGRDVHTVETSPESLTPEHAAVLQARGIERVSMGIQSLSGGVLDVVKRRHAAEQALAACDLLVSAGFVVNVDLIYGLPGQTHDSFRRDLETLAARGVQSITTYNLRVNERTPVGRSLEEHERLDLPALIRWRAMIRTTVDSMGFEPLRWHTFRRKLTPETAATAAGRFLDLTGRGNQFGAGVSARSRLESCVYRNHPSYDMYLARVESGENPVHETKVLSETERRLRYVALTLGDGHPLVLAEYSAEFGSEFADDFSEAAGQLEAAGLIRDEGQRLVMTAAGELVYDLVTRAFYPNPVRRWLDERQQLAHTAANLHPRQRPREAAPL